MTATNSPEAQPQEVPKRDDYDLAYAIVEEMGFGFQFRNCSCGQLPCARLRPIVDALAKREAEVRAVATPRATGEADALVDEVQHRMDLVVECAVEWHQSDEDWYEKSEALGAAIDSLLELRTATRTEGEGEK